MEGAISLFSAILLLLFAYVVFRRIVRHDYQDRGRLGWWASLAQLLIFLGYFTFPYLFSPPGWPWFWQMSGTASQALQIIGIVFIILGMLIAFGTMAWLGNGRKSQRALEEITRKGPYKISRNPQILGGYFLAFGVFLQWPSFYMIGWVLMYALIGHWMIITEEEHLGRVFGDEYDEYCKEVPRYLRIFRR